MSTAPLSAISSASVVDRRLATAIVYCEAYFGAVDGKTDHLPAHRGARATDCAIGKRTTATIVTRAVNDRGVNAVMVSTGQTGPGSPLRRCARCDPVAVLFGGDGSHRP